MRVVLQRCLEAAVTIDGQVVGEVGHGLLIVTGIAPEDSVKEVEWMCNKISGLDI